MEGRSVPAVLAVSLGRREVGSLDAGAKRKRAERSDAAAGGSNSTSAEEEASLKRRGEERPRSVTEAGTKSRWEKAEKGINGDDAPVAVGRQGRLRLHPPSAHPVQRLVNACRALLRCSGAAPPPAVVAFIGRMLNWLVEGCDDIDEENEENEAMQLRRSSRVRELHEDDFESDSECGDIEIEDEDVEFESDHDEVLPTKDYEQEDED